MGANFFTADGVSELSTGIPKQSDENGLYCWTWAPPDAIGLQSDMATKCFEGADLGRVYVSGKLVKEQTHYTFDKIVAGKYTFVLNRMKSHAERGGRGLNFAKVLEVPFEIGEGEQKTVVLSEATFSLPRTQPESRTE
ncbi:MAG: hypothetical protein FWC43_02260 [Planctomycetaceae bacterium]|nr:hypothetical protein [Planctomycetaceae bacterium]